MKRDSNVVFAVLTFLLPAFLLPTWVFAQGEDYSTRAAEIVAEMTLEEKVKLLSGADIWQTKAVERLGVPSIWMADGPHGLRRAPAGDNWGFPSQPATCFPTASALAASWDTALLYEVGQAIGREAQAQDVQIVLGPGVNLKRSPLGGRNFEYFSEDPLLTGQLAAAYINGVQSEGVGTSLKHFAANNQETQRFVVDARVDERSLRELYLKSFEIAVRESQPWTVMAAYNRLNGIYATQHAWLLSEILRDEWGFDGYVVSDWGAVVDPVAAINAGMDLRMPTLNPMDDALVLAKIKGAATDAEAIDTTAIDAAARNLLRVILRADALNRENETFDEDTHHALARKAAGRSVVLLENNGILPLQDVKRLTVIGAFAKEPRYQGAGSSRVTPTRLENAWDELSRRAEGQFEISWAAGYESEEIDDALLQEARQKASEADVALLFVGLPPRFEEEGRDREHMDLPPSHNALVQAVVAAQPQTVVVLSNGSAVALPWADQVAAVVEGWLGGQAGGEAVVDVLFGDVNPSGRLAETFARNLEQTPAFLNFPGDGRVVTYGENIFVGYRYYDTVGVRPHYPFGYGLSYTTFEYSDLKLTTNEIDTNEINDDGTLTATMKIRNSGDRAGAEVVQLYVADLESSAPRPAKELKAFARVDLEPGEEKEVSFSVDASDLGFFSPRQGWIVEPGEHELIVGASSRDLRLREFFTVRATRYIPPGFDRFTTLKEWNDHPRGKAMVAPMLQMIFASLGAGEDAESARATVLNLPIFKLVTFSGGMFTEQMIENMVRQINSPE